MDKKITLMDRIEKELLNNEGNIALYANDLKGNILEINCDEKYETASSIKVFILAELFRKIHNNEINLYEEIEYKKENCFGRKWNNPTS